MPAAQWLWRLADLKWPALKAEENAEEALASNEAAG